MTLALACGDDGSPAEGTEGSTGTSTSGVDSNEPSTSGTTASDPTTAGTTTSEPTGDTTDPDGSSGGPPTGTPGCGMEVAAGESTVEIQVDATARTYLLVVPDGYDPSTPMPLVFAWHGRSGTSEIARLYFQVEEAADGQAIFVYPQGLPIESMGGQTGWDLAPSGIDVAFFDAMLAEVSASVCIDVERVFTTGHSFGGYMSNALGCFRSSALRAMGAVAGGPPFGACEADTIAAWITHGTEDLVVPFSQGEASRDALLDRNGCAATTTAVEPAPCEAYDGCAEGMPVVWCPHDETDLSGHMWPRFAGAAIWAFFEGLAPKP
jgi:polyhydroxybutyrate depolymerase